MSIKTWKKEFYPVPAKKVADKSWIECIDHALKKWEGLKRQHLDKHKLYGDANDLYERNTDSDEDQLTLDVDNCALCLKTALLGERYETRCELCPVVLSGQLDCLQDGSAYDKSLAWGYKYFHPLFALNGLRKARKWVLKQEQKR